MLPGVFLETVDNLRIRIAVYPHFDVPEFPSSPCCYRGSFHFFLLLLNDVGKNTFVSVMAILNEHFQEM